MQTRSRRHWRSALLGPTPALLLAVAAVQHSLGSQPMAHRLRWLRSLTLILGVAMTLSACSSTQHATLRSLRSGEDVDLFRSEELLRSYIELRSGPNQTVSSGYRAGQEAQGNLRTALHGTRADVLEEKRITNRRFFYEVPIVRLRINSGDLKGQEWWAEAIYVFP